jgi:hypothetical protein
MPGSSAAGLILFIKDSPPDFVSDNQRTACALRQTLIEVRDPSSMSLRDHLPRDLETYPCPHAVPIKSKAERTWRPPVSVGLGGGAGHVNLGCMFRERSGHPINRGWVPAFVRVPVDGGLWPHTFWFFPGTVPALRIAAPVRRSA